jgi:hypothetical protein
VYDMLVRKYKAGEVCSQSDSSYNCT